MLRTIYTIFASSYFVLIIIIIVFSDLFLICRIKCDRIVIISRIRWWIRNDEANKIILSKCNLFSNGILEFDLIFPVCRTIYISFIMFPYSIVFKCFIKSAITKLCFFNEPFLAPFRCMFWGTMKMNFSLLNNYVLMKYFKWKKFAHFFFWT